MWTEERARGEIQYVSLEASKVFVFGAGKRLRVWQLRPAGLMPQAVATIGLRHMGGKASRQPYPNRTSAFRLTDRARSPTNLTTPPSDIALLVTHQFNHHPPSTTTPSTFSSSLLRHQQPKCRTLARRSSSGRPRGLCRLRRPRNGTLLMTSRSPRKSVHPTQTQIRIPVVGKDGGCGFSLEECDSCAGPEERADHDFTDRTWNFILKPHPSSIQNDNLEINV